LAEDAGDGVGRAPGVRLVVEPGVRDGPEHAQGGLHLVFKVGGEKFGDGLGLGRKSWDAPLSDGVIEDV